MDAPHCPRALKLPLLPHILSHPLMEIILWHTFPSWDQMVPFTITSTAILLDFSATSSGHQHPFTFL